MNILKLRNKRAPDATLRSDFFWPLLIELVVCIYHVPVGVEGTMDLYRFHRYLDQNETSCGPDNHLVVYGSSCYAVHRYNVDVLGVFMVLRLYLYARHLRNSSGLYSQWVSFIGMLNNVDSMHPFFHFKALFAQRPLPLVVSMDNNESQFGTLTLCVVTNVYLHYPNHRCDCSLARSVCLG